MGGKKPEVKHSYVILDQFYINTVLSVFCLFVCSFLLPLCAASCSGMAVFDNVAQFMLL